MKLSEIFDRNHASEEENAVYDICIANGITPTRVLDDLSVHVLPNVIFQDKDFEELPIKFNTVENSFSIEGCKNLKNINGVPLACLGSLSIENCESITTLKGLENTKVSDGFYIVELPNLLSLEFMPKGAGCIGIADCPHVTHDIRGIQEHLKFNRFANGTLYFDFNEVEKGGLGLIQVENLKRLSLNISLDLPAPFKIIQKYLGRPDDLFECQAELIDNGFEKFAEL